MHYRKDGTPIDNTIEWGVLFQDRAYKRIACDKLPKTKKWVSTVWLGLDHSFTEEGPPLIFETMAFSGKGFEELDCRRWATEAEAIAGHRDMVRWWRINHRARRKYEVRNADDPGRT